jgi:hypothetical protein
MYIQIWILIVLANASKIAQENKSRKHEYIFLICLATGSLHQLNSLKLDNYTN